MYRLAVQCRVTYSLDNNSCKVIRLEDLHSHQIVNGVLGVCRDNSYCEKYGILLPYLSCPKLWHRVVVKTVEHLLQLS